MTPLLHHQYTSSTISSLCGKNNVVAYFVDSWLSEKARSQKTCLVDSIKITAKLINRALKKMALQFHLRVVTKRGLDDAVFGKKSQIKMVRVDKYCPRYEMLKILRRI